MRPTTGKFARAASWKQYAGAALERIVQAQFAPRRDTSLLYLDDARKTISEAFDLLRAEMDAQALKKSK